VKAAAGPIRVLSLVLTAIVVVSFGMFVWDELGTASKSQAQLATASGIQSGYTRDVHGRIVVAAPSKIREKIDKANDTITSPGESIGKKVGQGNEWAMRGLAFIFGIALFLIGLRMLASWMELDGSPSGQVVQRGRGSYTAGSR
jgi:hypothetical protein